MTAPSVPLVHQGWQPIATMPKDGSEVIGGWAEFGLVDLIWWSFTETKIMWFDRVDGDGMPTHWMPLPDPPLAPLVPVPEEDTTP